MNAREHELISLVTRLYRADPVGVQAALMRYTAPDQETRTDVPPPTWPSDMPLPVKNAQQLGCDAVGTDIESKAEDPKGVQAAGPDAVGAVGPMPWDDADPKVKVPFQARLPERLHRKLVYLAERLPGRVSIQELLLFGTEDLADRWIADLEKSQGNGGGIIYSRLREDIQCRRRR
jgi:hypothetical protein